MTSALGITTGVSDITTGALHIMISALHITISAADITQLTEPCLRVHGPHHYLPRSGLFAIAGFWFLFFKQHSVTYLTNCLFRCLLVK